MSDDTRARILLVDDRPDNLVALESVLDELGEELVVAASGREALKRLLDDDFSVILLDVQMPGLDGFETASLIRSRERSRHTPIIFLTAINKENTHVFKGYSLGALDYVFKPYDPDILRAKVAAFVEMSRNVKRLENEIQQRKRTELKFDASNALLETISQAMMRFIADGEPEGAFRLMLHNLISLTCSEYGYIAEIRPGRDAGLHYLVVEDGAGPVHSAGGRVGAGFSTSLNNRAICRALMKTGMPFIANAPADVPLRKTTQENNAVIGCLLAVPIHKGEEFIGVVCIADRPDGYGSEIASYLEPFCNTCASIVFSFRNSLRRRQAEDEVRHLNEELECRVVERTAELQAANGELEQEVLKRKKADEILAGKQSHIETLNEQLRRSMKETDHRVKNNLQMIAAMLDMRLMDDAETIPVEELKRLSVHVRTLAAVHDLLTKEAQEDGQVHYLSSRTILGELLPLLQDTAESRAIRFAIADIRLTARQGTSLALVVNELVSNALKHGHGDVAVNLGVEADEAVLCVQDNGPGFPPTFDPVAQAHTGLDLVRHISRWDLGGETHYENRPGGGGQVRITIPLKEPQMALVGR